MLARSLAALLGGALAVAAVPGAIQFLYEEYDAPAGQWPVDRPRLPRPPIELPHEPHHEPHHPKVDDKTIFQALEDDHRFSRVFKLVNISDEVTSLLNDSSQAITFFAPPDRALKPPKRGGKHHARKDTDYDELGIENFFGGDNAEPEDELELFAALEGFVDETLLTDDDDDKDKERRRKIIKKIVTAVLKYHVLPGELSAHELAKNTTFPTALSLHEGSFDGQPLRLRVEQPPRLLKPTLSLNFYAKVLYADVKTKNGIIHVVNHPLLPPPSIFTTLFAFFDHFSTLTSAIQRVNFTDAIDWHWVRKSETLEGNPALTFFAPTNIAFSRLPRRLKFYLFSPFGHHALKKILAFHTIPDVILHTNWLHKASDVGAHTDVVDAEGGYYDEIPQSFEWEDINAKQKKAAAKGSVMATVKRFQEGPARPECDGYGFASGQYDHHPHPPPHGSPPPPDHPPPERDPHHGPFPKPKPVWHANGTFATLLPNHTLSVHVAQFHSVLPHRRYSTVLAVNGHFVTRTDVPARNGAAHVVSRLISPRRHHEKHDLEYFVADPEAAIARNDQDWEDWEDWLPQWAAEQ